MVDVYVKDFRGGRVRNDLIGVCTQENFENDIAYELNQGHEVLLACQIQAAEQSVQADVTDAG